MTDLAAIKAELRRLADEAKTLVEPSAEYDEWQRQAAHAFVNFAVPLLADTPSVEPPTHPHDGYAYDGCKCVCCTNVRALATPPTRVCSGCGRTIAAEMTLHFTPDGETCPRGVEAFEAGRPSVEPAGLARQCSFMRGLDGYTNCTTHGWTGYRDDVRRVAVCPALLPTQASDSPEPKETT